MGARTRSRNVLLATYVGSSYWRTRVPSTQTKSNTAWDVQTTDDVVGNYPNPNGFYSITRTRGPVCLLSGQKYLTTPPYSLDKEYAGAPCTWSANATDPPSWSPSSLELGNFAFEVKERTNPSRPHVSVPTIIGELKDIPSLVRKHGDSLLKRVADSHLTWRWAVRPMLSDVWKMLIFLDAFEERARQIKNLSNAGKSSSRVGLGSTAVTTSLTDVVIESTLGEVITCGRTQTITTHTWGSCRWKTTDLSYIPVSKRHRNQLVNRLMYGITSYESLAATWELLPWSWFADWFFGIGDMISANNNTLQLTSGSFCIMRTGTCRVDYHVKSKPAWVTCSSLPRPSLTVKKQRFVSALAVPPLPSLAPLVTADKWLILASLFAVKAKAGSTNLY